MTSKYEFQLYVIIKNRTYQFLTLLYHGNANHMFYLGLNYHLLVMKTKSFQLLNILLFLVFFTKILTKLELYMHIKKNFNIFQYF